MTDAADLKAEAKRLMRMIRSATLATLDATGAPFASLTAVATWPEGQHILLLSRLAAHTLHLETDGRCSLLLSQGGKGDPLAHPRLTLTGRAARVSEQARDRARARFLARNPKAELYADFPDFGFWSVTLDRAHLNGGFARAASFASAELLTDIEGCDELLEQEAGAVAHMNDDHADAIRLYATALLDQPDGPWRISGIDPEGADLLNGDRTARLRFPERVTSGAELRRILVRLSTQAREQRG